MNKKWLVTSLCAATIFTTSLTAANASNPKEEVKSEPQQVQINNYQGLAFKLINQIFMTNQGFKIDIIKDFFNKFQDNQDAYKVIDKEIKSEKAISNHNEKVPTKNNNLEVSTNSNKVEVPAKNNAKAPTNSNKIDMQETNNNAKTPTKSNKYGWPSSNNYTKAPTNSNQTVEAPVKTTPQDVSQSVSNFEKQVVDLTNAERTKAGLKPLEMYSPLMKSAHAKSQDMANKHYFSHTSPTYGSPFDQMKAAGISYRSAGENIAQGQKTPQQVVQAWMESPGHRQNILNANYTHIGVGFVENGYYWTQQFIQQ